MYTATMIAFWIVMAIGIFNFFFSMIWIYNLFIVRNHAFYKMATAEEIDQMVSPIESGVESIRADLSDDLREARATVQNLVDERAVLRSELRQSQDEVQRLQKIMYTPKGLEGWRSGAFGSEAKNLAIPDSPDSPDKGIKS